MAGDGKEEALYDLYDCGRYDGRYSTSELMGMLGIRYRSMISRYGRYGTMYRKRYVFERVDEPVSDELADEWDRMRLEILRAGR